MWAFLLLSGLHCKCGVKHDLSSDLYDREAAVNDNGFTNDLDLVFLLCPNQSLNSTPDFSAPLHTQRNASHISNTNTAVWECRSVLSHMQAHLAGRRESDGHGREKEQETQSDVM